MPELTVESRDWRGLHRSNPHPFSLGWLFLICLFPYLPPNTHQLIHTECPHSVPLKPTMQATLQDSDLIQVRRQRKKNKIKRNPAEVLIQTGAGNGDRLKPCILNLTSSSLAFQTWMWFPFFQFSHWVLQSGLHPSVSGVVIRHPDL